MNYYLAIDIGASSGRHIVGWNEDGILKTQEVYRFENGVSMVDGHLTWDIEHLVNSVKEGIARAKEAYGCIKSLSIDTWGVDYVLLKDDTEVFPCYAYRDSRTQEVIPKVHEKIPFDSLYRHTGCQFQIFTSVYQLAADRKAGRLESVTDFLMMPEYLMYKLCGRKAKEYTNATTTGLINAQTGEFDTEIIETLDFPMQLFRDHNGASLLKMPGTVIGSYDGIDVVLCATHDTGSAVEGIPMEGNELYISSGTWSLLGVKTAKPLTDTDSQRANYSNEGGVGYNRYQKNLMGMWLVNSLRSELCPGLSFSQIVALAEESTYDEIINVEDQSLLAPVSMKEAINGLLTQKDSPLPVTIGDYFRCAYVSLAYGYQNAIRELENNTGSTYRKLYIVGGGAKNAFLNRLTQEYTGKEVIALPIEATAIGNLMIQMKNCNEVCAIQ